MASESLASLAIHCELAHNSRILLCPANIMKLQNTQKFHRNFWCARNLLISEHFQEIPKNFVFRESSDFHDYERTTIAQLILSASIVQNSAGANLFVIDSMGNA